MLLCAHSVQADPILGDVFMSHPLTWSDVLLRHRRRARPWGDTVTGEAGVGRQLSLPHCIRVLGCQRAFDRLQSL